MKLFELELLQLAVGPISSKLSMQSPTKTTRYFTLTVLTCPSMTWSLMEYLIYQNTYGIFRL
jgi:hypothetical protein